MASRVDLMHHSQYHYQSQQETPLPKRDMPEHISERISHLERAVRRCEAVQDRLADIVGAAFSGHLEAGLASLETRLSCQQEACEKRMQEQLDRIETCLHELKQSHDGTSFAGSFPHSSVDTLKLEDMLQLLDNT